MSKKLSLVATIWGQYLARPHMSNMCFPQHYLYHCYGSVICVSVTNDQVRWESSADWNVTTHKRPEKDAKCGQTNKSTWNILPAHLFNNLDTSNYKQVGVMIPCRIIRLLLYIQTKYKKKLYCIVCTCITKLTKVSKLCRAMQKFLRWCWIS